MSFGFEEEVRLISAALNKAHDKNVLMVAAASNRGGNAGLTWPAKSSLVLSIFATDGDGNYHGKSPTSQTYRNNFATLGCAVKSWWPEHLGKGLEIRRSGTSTATAVAASIAATIMDIVRQKKRATNLSQQGLERLKKLGTADGMGAVFREMVDCGLGCDYLEPWHKMLNYKLYIYDTTILDNIWRYLK